MFRKTTLKNGLRLVTQKLESTKAVTVLILVGSGSRYETKDINGIAHFLEHMFFKGAEKYKNTKEVSEAIDSVGGEFNAFTGKEYVGYYVKVAGRHKDVAMDVLSDMLINAKLDPDEINRERGVIMEEYNMYQDTPMHQIGWDFERLIYGDQPMGWDQVGTKDVIMNVKRDDFVKYRENLYTADNIIVAITGNIDHDEVVKDVRSLFEFDVDKKSASCEPFKGYATGKRIFLRNKKTEQAHIQVGFTGYPEPHRDYYAGKVLSIILGGSMSSRMFLSVRERQGLAYYISSTVDGYTDSGTLTTNAGVSLDGIEKAITAIMQEYEKITGEEVPEKELKKAKEFFKGKLILRLEDSEEYAHLLSKFELLYGKVKTPEEIFKEIDHVSVKDINRIARELFIKDKLYLAVIGPYEDEEKFKKLLRI
jgi:predicted Zn-dependent peptidase